MSKFPDASCITSGTSSEVRGTPDTIIGSSRMASGVIEDPDANSDSSEMATETKAKEEEEISSADKMKTGEAFSRRCRCPRHQVDDVENEHLNVLEIVVNHQVDEHIEDDTLCRTDVDPTIVKRLVVRHVTNDFIDNVDEHLSHASETSDDDEL
ncbi:uncharacterized protein E5676_scaffold1163G00170 [Cucumis melo var. makuwa]|uniref:Uncharacterized protein n=1 Tax=Cucumis melo var. makuwa TaxID=1194695 RepID=A0A5D3DH77_CUCMM|nr:uncharacterized protein E6C27_scaffold43052G00400 [Cucumis melo var. makuwa]TYK22700.1 uncharacterized protein E5676_scaffold1163G00170 [Cucumis melo var. makuwa]